MTSWRCVVGGRVVCLRIAVACRDPGALLGSVPRRRALRTRSSGLPVSCRSSGGGGRWGVRWGSESNSAPHPPPRGVWVPAGGPNRRGNLACNPAPCGPLANPSSSPSPRPLAGRTRGVYVPAGTGDFLGLRVRGGEEEKVKASPPPPPRTVWWLYTNGTTSVGSWPSLSLKLLQDPNPTLPSKIRARPRCLVALIPVESKRLCLGAHTIGLLESAQGPRHRGEPVSRKSRSWRFGPQPAS